MEAKITSTAFGDVLDLFVPPSEAMAADAASEDATAEPEFTGTHHRMSLDAIAAIGALLGTESDEETIQSILYIRENGEPMPDPITGRNAWTTAYEQLEAEARDEPLTASADAENGIDATRRALGLPPRAATFSASAMETVSLPAIDESVTTALAEASDKISELREEFLAAMVPKREG